jgi:hypothetical protein
VLSLAARRVGESAQLTAGTLRVSGLPQLAATTLRIGQGPQLAASTRVGGLPQLATTLRFGRTERRDALSLRHHRGGGSIRGQSSVLSATVSRKGRSGHCKRGSKHRGNKTSLHRYSPFSPVLNGQPDNFYILAGSNH